MKAEKEWFYYDDFHYSKEYYYEHNESIVRSRLAKKIEIQESGGIYHHEITELAGSIILERVGELLPRAEAKTKIKPMLEKYIESFKGQIPEGVEIVDANLNTDIGFDGTVMVSLSVTYNK